MPNSNPTQSDEFVQHQFQPPADIPDGVKLAKQPLTIKVPIGIDQAVRDLGGEKAAWLRKVICEAAIRDGLVDKIE